MKEIIEKLVDGFNKITAMSEYQDCYDLACDMISYGDDYLNHIKQEEELKSEAMEKQPTEYEYVHLTESDFDVWDLKDLLDGGELFSKRSDGKYSQYSDRSPLYMLGHFGEYGVYRRIPITAEQLHERRVDELARVIWKSNPNSVANDFDSDVTPEWKCGYIAMAKSALEWMEPKGK